MLRYYYALIVFSKKNCTNAAWNLNNYQALRIHIILYVNLNIDIYCYTYSSLIFLSVWRNIICFNMLCKILLVILDKLGKISISLYYFVNWEKITIFFLKSKLYGSWFVYMFFRPVFFSKFKSNLWIHVSVFSVLVEIIHYRIAKKHLKRW